MKKYYITGISGNGKSTIAQKLKENGISAIDIDEDKLCRWINKSSKEISHWHPGLNKEFFKNHDYVCDQEKLFSIMEGMKDPVVVVGLADNQKDFINRFDKVFLFQSNPKILFERIKDRIDNDFGKHEEEQKMILGWYKSFEKETLEQGAIAIDTSKPIDEVYNNLLKKIID